MAKSDTKKTPETVENNGTAPDVVDNLDITCHEIALEYINTLDDPNELKDNNGLFVGMLKYIYKNYLGDIIGNKNNTYIHYDYDLLDKLFYIYTDFVYRYKQNKRPTIIEFSLFVGMDRNTIHNAAFGLTKKLTPQQVSKCKRWYSECESCLVNGSSVFEIFLLKSQYRYNDNMAPVPLESQGPALSVQELPDLGSCQNAISDKTGDDHNKGKT